MPSQFGVRSLTGGAGRLLLGQVDRLLAAWEERARAMPDEELRRQALASLRLKRFHCEGGAVYALRHPAILPAIVSLQTISDYLDNLCDRSAAGGEADMRRLHQAFLDAVRPEEPLGDDFYALHPAGEDGGYLEALAADCRRVLAGLPGWPAVRAEAVRLAGWYVELQVLKHQERERREALVRDWALGLPAPGLEWWEAAAATGSTLGLFALFEAAAGPGCDAALASAVREAYFPAVAALHILLDYWIDLDEDRLGGDLNFAACYPDPGTAAQRIARLIGVARGAVAGLPDADFHRLVVAGLPAMYLSDPKVRWQGFRFHAARILFSAGPPAWAFWWWLQARRWRAVQ